MHVWDLRRSAEPLLSFSEPHTHWVWNALFHPEHDSLLLTTSSDTSASLISCPSLRSQGVSADSVDGVAARLDSLHTESVYGAAWSQVEDCWAFATLGYDGKLVVNQVPSEVKYDAQL